MPRRTRGKTKLQPRDSQSISEPRVLDLPSRDYQPSKAELEEEFDFPGASLETVRNAFFRPITTRVK